MVCYPTLIAATVVLPVSLFLSLKKANVGYLPFAVDRSGGLKKYLSVFDRPIFIAQSLTVVIAIANYIGWGGFTTVSTILAIGAPTVVGLVALSLYLSFFSLVRSQKNLELQKLSDRQNALYEELLDTRRVSSGRAKEITEELEASLRVSDILKTRRNWGWVKYVLNVAIAVAPKLLDQEVITNFFDKALS